MLRIHQKVGILWRKVANLAAFLQNNNLFAQENQAFKKIPAARKVHASAISHEFCRFSVE